MRQKITEYYPKYAPSAVRCPICGGILEIWAFGYEVIRVRDNKRITQYEPVLVCNDRCNTFFGLDSFNITKKDLQLKIF